MVSREQSDAEKQIGALRRWRECGRNSGVVPLRTMQFTVIAHKKPCKIKS